MYLKFFGIENFRIFKDPVEFEFRPITILVGENNSGKTTLLKALNLLIENSIKGKSNKSIPDQLYTTLPKIGIGSNKDLFPVNSNSDKIEFKLILEGNTPYQHSFFFDNLIGCCIHLKYKSQPQSSQILYLEEISILKENKNLISWKPITKSTQQREEKENIIGFHNNKYVIYPAFAEAMVSNIANFKNEFIEISENHFKKNGNN